MGPGPRSAGFDEIEAGYAQQAAEEGHNHDEPREPEYQEEDEEAPVKNVENEEDEFAIAEREYLNEMRSGMNMATEDEIAI